MTRFLLRRLAQSAVVLVVAISVVFLLLRTAPGDPLSATSLDATSTAESRALIRERFALDRPLPTQYLRFVGGALRGDLGPSLSRGRPVTTVLAEVLPNSLLLMGTALLLGVAAGLVLGTWQGHRVDARFPRATHTIGLLVLGTPEYIIATAALGVGAAGLGLFPVGGMTTLGVHDTLGPIARVGDVLRHLALPATTLALVIAVLVARYQRSEVRTVLAMPFIRTARAKGLAERRVLWAHAFPNALGPVIALCGLLLPTLAGGALFVEAIFAWPGMGHLMVEAVNGRDYPLTIGIVVLGSVLTAVGGLLADVAAGTMDPRLRRPR